MSSSATRLVSQHIRPRLQHRGRQKVAGSAQAVAVRSARGEETFPGLGCVSGKLKSGWVDKEETGNIRNEESMSCGRVDTGRQGGSQVRRSRREQGVQGREVKQGQGRVEISAEVGAISRSGEIMAPSSYR